MYIFTIKRCVRNNGRYVVRRVKNKSTFMKKSKNRVSQRVHIFEKHHKYEREEVKWNIRN